MFFNAEVIILQSVTECSQVISSINPHLRTPDRMFIIMSKSSINSDILFHRIEYGRGVIQSYLIHIVGPHLILHNLWLPDDRKRLLCDISDGLLNVLRNDGFRWFLQIVKEDEFRFSCPYESIHCYAKSPPDVPLWRKQHLPEKQPWQLDILLEWNFWSCT
jgi:hypothetical protein